MKYLVTTTVIDMRTGKVISVPFFADTAERAQLLQDLLMTCRIKGGGTIQSFVVDNSELQLREALPPAQLNL